MKKIRKFIVDKPLLSSVILVLLIQSVFHFDVWFLRVNLFETLFNISEDMALTIKRIITSAFCILFMTKCLDGNLKDIGYKFKDAKRGFKICLIGVVYVLIFHVSGLLTSFINNEGHWPGTPEEIKIAVETFITCLVVGFFEETAYRIVTINVLRNKEIKEERKKMFYCLICSSVLFGLIHLPNILGGYETPLGGIATIISAAGFGMFLGAMYWISGSIVPSMIFHFVWDLLSCKGDFYIINTVSTITQTSGNEMSVVKFNVVVAAIGILAALFVLRKKSYQGCKISQKALADKDAENQ